MSMRCLVKTKVSSLLFFIQKYCTIKIIDTISLILMNEFSIFQHQHKGMDLYIL